MNNLTPSAVSPSLFLFLPDSICPKGWELPRYSNDKSYLRLLKEVYGQQTGSGNGGKGMFKAPLSLIHTGAYAYYNGDRTDKGWVGYYWVPRVADKTIARYLYFSFANINPQNGASTNYGMSIRCVSK